METKSKRLVFKPYIPVHRRNQPEKVTGPPPPAPVRALLKEEAEVKRRGRGQFRAPLNEDNDTTSTIDKDLRMNPQNPGYNMSIEKLTEKVEKLATETDDDKDDWEDEWETSEDNVEIKVESKKTVVPKDPTPSIDDDELTTILDCYDFPSSFKTHHLQDMFLEYESIKGGYSIQWMSDTRALIIFQHPYTAKKAYIGHNNPLVKIRPYKGKVDSKPSGPVPRRPVTTDMVARRLVHSALGVRSTKSAEQRQAENELLKAAKEQRLAQKANNAIREKQIASAFDE